jgi:DNA-binding response OmpR family regulator
LELKARIKAILRRSARKGGDAASADIIKVRELEIDKNARSVVLNGAEVNLTAKEFDVLELFMENPGKVYGRDSLLKEIWGYEHPGDARTVDVHVRRLREKIEENPSDPKYIHTKWGVGYFFK